MIENGSDNTPKNEAIKQVALEKSPFALFDLSTRDNRKTITEAIESKGFAYESEICSKARADLTNPRNRLVAEIAWMPGISPKRAHEFLASLRSNLDFVLENTDSDPLTASNLLASALELLQEGRDALEWSSWISKLAKNAESIDSALTLKAINEDRAVSGFPEVQSVDLVEKEFAERRRYYKNAAFSALDRLDSEKLLKVMTELVESGTASGTKHADRLIDDLVDAYQLEIENVLLDRAKKIVELIDLAEERSAKGESAFKPIFEEIKAFTVKWGEIARPVQLGLKSRGLEHDLSVQLGRRIRGLAVDIANKHNMLNAAKEITEFLGNSFVELPEFSASLDEDVQALDNLLQQRDKSEAENEEWKTSITREIELGFLFKTVFKCSPEGVRWGNRHYALKDITRIRWGGTKHSVNGIPTGTSYKIAFGDNTSEAVISVSNKDIYTMMIECLWKAVCIGLMSNMLRSLKAGEKIRIGSAIIDDDGIELTRHKMFSSERVHCPWGKVGTWNASGSFFIRSNEDKKAFVQLSYEHDANTHILEACVTAAFKKFNGKLSGLLG